MTDLTTLDSAKAWLGATSPDNDAELTAMIKAASQFILTNISRPSIFRKTYTEKFAGSRSQSRMLRNYPVIDVSAVTMSGLSIPSGDGITQEYWLEPGDDEPPGRPQMLNLNGYCFGPGLCQITYDAGYFVSAEAQTASSSVPVDAPYGPWAVDGGVTLNSTAMTPVTGTPAPGQYSVEDGTYTFNAGDAGQPVLISYSYVPAALAQACNQLVGEQFKYKDRIGTMSKTLGGQETVSYKLTDMPAYVATLLKPFKRLVPL